jgi:hypothetical protein
MERGLSASTDDDGLMSCGGGGGMARDMVWDMSTLDARLSTLDSRLSSVPGAAGGERAEPSRRVVERAKTTAGGQPSAIVWTIHRHG